MKRFLSMLTAILLVLSMVPAVSFATEPVTVYMDPEKGNNANSGTEASPVQDFAGAYALLQKGGGTVVMLSDITFSAAYTLPACDYPVTITSKTGAEGIRSNSHILIAGETTFENMSFTLLKVSTGTTICACGYKLTMGEGVTTVPFMDGTSAYYFCLQGGDPNKAVASTDLTVRSGYYRYLYAGGYTQDVTGDVKLTMTGGTAANLATCRTGNVSGNVTMNFSGTATVAGALYAGAATSGDLKGNCTITLGQGAQFKNFYAGSNGSGEITGVTTVICDGFDGTFTTFKGKGGSSSTGKLGGSRLLLKSGTLTKAPTDFANVTVEIPADKTFTLACDLSAHTVSGTGTLAFSGTASLTAAAVSGTVHCATVGEALQNHVYVTAPAGADLRFPTDSGVTEMAGQWLKQDLDAFAGLVIVSDSANTVKLHQNIWNRGDSADYPLVEPFRTVTQDGLTYRYYPNAQGGFHVRVSRSGYITVYKDIYMSPEEAATKTVQTVTLDKTVSGGFAPTVVYSHTDEVLASAWKSDISMYPKYAEALQNPVFEEGRHPHLQTTNEELEASIASVDGEKDDMYVFSLGKSDRFGYNIPMVIFTKSDLSGATTLAEAAALLDNSRLNIFYRAQIHGNEPAGGEGALAMIHYLQQGYGDQLLDRINLVIIPRLSPDSAQLYQRPLYNSSHTCDHLLLQTGEVQALQEAYLLFRPEVVLDGHERNWNNQGGDIQVSTSFTPMNSDAWQATALAMDQAAFRELENNNLCGSYYSGAVNGYDPNMANAYFTTAGSLYVLMESRGIYGGNEAIVRRTVAHLAAVRGLLDYLHENGAQVKNMVAQERLTFARNGATYETDDVIVLETASRPTTAADREAWGNLKTDRQTVDWQTGNVTFPTKYPAVYDAVKRSRPLPTAYVIPADAPGIEQVLTMARRHGIPYTQLPEGATLALQHYGGTVAEATLSPETVTRFAEGCYVFTMNQEKALVLATLMEPDVTNAASYGGTLAQRGFLQVTHTYRYIRDLNSQGTVDYTVTDATFVNVTVWLDGTNGNDNNDGLTEATAVKTLEKAYALLNTAMEGADKGSQVNLKILGLYELGAGRVSLPTADFHVTISGKTTADGFCYTGGSSQSTRNVDIQGDTTFQNMTLHCNNTGSYNHINANGHKVVFGVGLNCTAKKENCYFTLAGGAYSSTTCASTDLTVRSGKWRTIYAGGYLGHVTGLAKADISGAWVYNNIAPTYRGNVGSAEIAVSNTELPTETYSNIYAGPLQYSASAKSGAVLGNSTVILGENITGKGAYASACLNGYIYGTATVIADGVDLLSFPVSAVCERLESGTTAAAVLKLGCDITENVTLDAALQLDLNGYDITGNLTVDGTLTVCDSATDDYDVSDGKYGEITGTVTGTLVAKEGYIAAANGFHKFGGQYISGVSLRPSNAGIYYTATFLADEVLLSELETGVAVSLVDLPSADFATDEDTLYTTGTNSVLVQNILRGNADDADRAIMDIYAASYVKLSDGTVLVSDENVAYSLYDILLILKEQNPTAFDSFTTQQNIQAWF